MYLKPRTKLRLRFNHNIADFNEDVYFPNEGHQIKRSPMRRRYNKEGQNSWTEWYSDLGHGCEDWHTADTMIEGFIHKNIGNKFDDVFHEFISKVRIRRELHCYGYHTPKSMFLGYFEKNKRRRTKEIYYVDDNGIIRHIPWKPKKHNDIIIIDKKVKYPYEYIYTLKEDALLSISIPFISLFGRELYDELLLKKTFYNFDLQKFYKRMLKRCSKETFENVFNQIRKYREVKRYYYGYSSEKWICFLFSCKYNNIARVIRYGTKEYYQYIKEQKHLKAIKIKERKHPNRLNFDNTLKNKKIAYNIKKRLENIAKKEMQSSS